MSSPAPMRPSSIKLPEEMRQRLQAVAQQAGHTVGEEIRRRLEASFETGSADAKTRRAMESIARLVDHPLLRGQWHADPHAFAAFKEGVLWLLSGYEPQGDPRKSPHAKHVRALFGSTYTLPVLGRLLAMTSQTLEPEPWAKRSKE